MATTELFAEILLVGLLATPWAVIALSWLRPLPTLPDVGGWAVVLTAVVLALLYALGIVVDRLGDVLFEKWDEGISRSVRHELAFPNHETLSRPEVRFRVMAAARESIVEYLDYARSRRRVARGLAFNSVLLAVVGLADLFRHQFLRSPTIFVTLDPILVIVGVAAAAFAVFVWRDIGRMYFQRSLLAYRLFVSEGRGSPTT
jgi:hypothetical protein